MRLEPIISEKTMKLAEEGRYTFRVERGMNKFQIKRLVEDVFGVHVTSINTLKIGGELRRSIRGRKRFVQPTKKAIVRLKDKEKIELFETKKKK